ncbi:MAG TPA: hypothetical protein ENF42_01645, partial [Candidatus Bathyarchaeota archaeon]|nr:hypothetical protein [Candidatus Bathyarchaeota archaeon]
MAQPKYRSKVRICVDILKVIEEHGKARPTKILYMANLSHDRLKKYIDDLLSKKLIEEDRENSHITYTLT